MPVQAINRRVLVIGIDGMRPDMYDPQVMPALASLIDRGTRFVDHHAVYPPHTRVNVTSLATGVNPGRHGIVANVFQMPGATDDGVIDTSNYDSLTALNRFDGGSAVKLPTLADMLDDDGYRLAVSATSSAGAAILWTLKHPYRVVNVNTDYGRADLYSLREKLGAVPGPGTEHRHDRQLFAGRAVTDIYLDDPEIKVIVLWMNEPDSSLHFHGLGAPEVREALTTVDCVIGQVLDAVDQRGVRDQFDIFVVSDHGHSTVRHHRSLDEYLDSARRELGDNNVPAVLTASDYIYSACGVSDPASFEPLVRWLQEQPWVGVVFGNEALAGLPGVIPLGAVWGGAISERAPLLAVSPAWTDEPNDNGVPGTVAALTEHVALRSTHGAASPFDLHAFSVASGPDFAEGKQSHIATGAIDLAPNILSLLGKAPPHHLDGRIWWEARVDAYGDPGEPSEVKIEPERSHPDGFAPALKLHRVGDATYLDRSINGNRMDSRTLTANTSRPARA